MLEELTIPLGEDAAIVRDEALQSRQELASLLQGASVGLALFDERFNLVVCNPLYRTLMGFRADEACHGANLADLIMLSASRETTRDGGVKHAIDSALDALRSGRSHRASHITPDGTAAEITRRVIAGGMMVETVRDCGDSAGSASARAFANVADAARSMMVQALDVMADGFALFDAHDRLVVYNRSFVDFSGAIADLVRPGIRFDDLLRAMAERGAFAMGNAARDAFVAERLALHRGAALASEVQLSCGRWFQLTERQTDDGSVILLVGDITHIKQREIDLRTLSMALRARNAQFDAALSNMAQGFCLFDANNRLLVANRRYYELFGYSPDIIKPGMERLDIVRHSLALGHLSADEAAEAIATVTAAAKLNARFTARQRFPDGRVVSIMSEPMGGGGTVATYTDVTALEKTAEQLRDHALKLERSNRDLEEFAYVASHDLQEPLRKIEAFGDRLTKRYGATLPEDGQMYIERMQNAAGRMRRLIGDLLGYSRVMTKANPRRQIELDAVVRQVIEDLQVRIDETGAEIRWSSLPNIDADPTQMGQLFQNLLSNALKFTRPGIKPVIEITARVDGDMDDAPGDRCVHISITDNGIGFDNKYKDQIFKIFQRLHGRHEYEGTGVGLATVRKIVERHRGEIDCDGRPGAGATFTIRLPVSSKGRVGADAQDNRAALCVTSAASNPPSSQTMAHSAAVTGCTDNRILVTSAMPASPR